MAPRHGPRFHRHTDDCGARAGARGLAGPGGQAGSGQRLARGSGAAGRWGVIDPIEVTEQYGTDAVRFALAASAAPGTDIAFSVDKIEANCNFANKLWNAGRFVLMHLEKLPESMKRPLAAALEPIPELGFEPLSRTAGTVREPRGSENAPTELADRWIFSRLQAVAREMNDAFASYRFHETAHTIYHFFWHEFCDWYLEWVKPEITVGGGSTNGSKPPAAWINLTRAFNSALHLLHPFMPFITEELWHRLPRAGGPRSVSLAPFTLVNERAADSVSEKQFADLQELIVAARNAKAEMGLQNARPSAQVASQDARCWRFTATIRKASRAWPASRRSTSRAPGSRAGRD